MNKDIKKSLISLGLFINILLASGCSKTIECEISEKHMHKYRNSIGIESCINHGSDYNDTMRILAKLLAELILEYNLSIDRIKQHWHFSGKDCPGVIRHCDRWEEFLNLVRLEYFAKTELKDVTFEWTSLVPDHLDNAGHVINSDGSQFNISYKVKYTIDGESYEKEYMSTILAQGHIKLGDWE